MTFNTPWGRFRFVCLSWGLACTQDIFQWMMDQILTQCKGVIDIADDVVVHGKDDKEHNKHLHKFMRVTHEHGLVFNKKKCWTMFQISINRTDFISKHKLLPVNLTWLFQVYGKMFFFPIGKYVLENVCLNNFVIIIFNDFPFIFQ